MPARVMRSTLTSMLTTTPSSPSRSICSVRRLSPDFRCDLGAAVHNGDGATVLGEELRELDGRQVRADHGHPPAERQPAPGEPAQCGRALPAPPVSNRRQASRQ